MFARSLMVDLKKRIIKYTRNAVSKVLVQTLFLVIIIFAACARQASPTGGPKDEDPPVPIKSSPINYSTNFTGDKIIIQFDEYIVLKNVTQEMLVSPPLDKQPEVKLRGKNMIIKMLSQRKDSTTYGINFYESVTDLNEGNLLKNFQFEFSTGDKFDSLYLGGNVKDAFNYKAEKGLYVMLYETMDDSIPRKTKPSLVAKTDESGNFFVSNLKPCPYYIFALRDLNNNLLFDLPNEAVAFSDSTFSPSFKEVEMVDTLLVLDSISPDFKDTIYVDSIHRYNKFVTTIDNIQLLFFQEDYEQQYFKTSYRKEREQVIFAFNCEVNDSFSIRPLVDTAYNPQWYVMEKQTPQDSLIYWLNDSALYNIDSLKFELSYVMKDSNSQNYIRIDTITTVFTEPETNEKDDKKDKKEHRFNLNLNDLFDNEDKKEKDTNVFIPSKLTLSHNGKAPFELNTNLSFLFRYPIASFSSDKIQFIKIEDDTIKKPVKFNLQQDSLLSRSFEIQFDKGPEEHFNLLIPTGSFTDIYGNTNDTLNIEFTTRELEYYGNIKLKIIKVKENAIVQLLNSDEKIIEEREISSDTTLEYTYLVPNKYLIKLFYDKNNNKKWDTGNFKTRKQPEEVFYFPQEIETKSNFDFEYDWDLYPKNTDGSTDNRPMMISEPGKPEQKPGGNGSPDKDMNPNNE